VDRLFSSVSQSSRCVGGTDDRRQVDTVDSPSDLYATLMEFIVRLAKDGLIHGDFNEFNILIRRKDGEPVIIDFPQMVSTRHPNAELYVYTLS
jgi:RIO kinase 2